MAIAEVAGLQAESRTFTSPDGRTLQAEILKASPESVTLQLTNGQSIVAPVDKFSPEDQAFIAKWRKENPEVIKYNFSASYKEAKINSIKSFKSDHEITTEAWECTVNLGNRSGETLEGLEVEYTIYFTQISNNQPTLRAVSGTSKLPSLRHLQEESFKTKSVQLVSSKLAAGFYYADGSRSRQKDDIEGLSLKIKHAGKIAYEWTSQGLTPERIKTARKTR